MHRPGVNNQPFRSQRSGFQIVPNGIESFWQPLLIIESGNDNGKLQGSPARASAGAKGGEVICFGRDGDLAPPGRIFYLQTCRSLRGLRVSVPSVLKVPLTCSIRCGSFIKTVNSETRYNVGETHHRLIAAKRTP